MSHSLFVAFVMFATVMFFTPGPNNIMLLSSGLTYGLRPAESLLALRRRAAAPPPWLAA